MKDNGVICPLPWYSIGMSPHGRIRTCGRARPTNSPTLKKQNLEECYNIYNIANMKAIIF